MKYCFILHFLKIELRSQSLASFLDISAFYASNSLPAFSPDLGAHLIIEIEAAHSSTAFKFASVTDGIVSDFSIWSGRWIYQNGRFFAREPGHYGFVIEFNLAENRIRANLGKGFSENPNAIAYGFLRAVFQTFLLPFYRMKTVHAAALARGGYGILMLGDSGAGKSTVALQMQRAGYTLLSDDGPILTIKDSTTYMLSSLDYLHISKNTLELFPETNPFLLPGKSLAGKYMINRQAFQPDSLSNEPTKISHLIRLHRTQIDRPRIIPIGRAEMLKYCMDEFMQVFRQKEFQGLHSRFMEHQAFSLDVLTSMVQQSQGYVMEFSDCHLQEIPRIVESIAD